MENQLTELIGTIMGELKEISRTEAIVGEPVSLGDKMVVPVTKLSLGFAVGGGEGKAPERVVVSVGPVVAAPRLNRWDLSLFKRIMYRFSPPNRVNLKV